MTTRLGGVCIETRDGEVSVNAPLRHLRDAFDRSVALVLGVNDYRHGVPALKTAVPDAEAVGALLETQHGFTQLLRRDAEVSCDRMRAMFAHELATEVGGPLTERDRLLIYFAGHGVSLPSVHGPEGHLLLSDADASDRHSYFAMDELRALVGALPCRHVLFVFDCCFAGTFRWAGRRVARDVATPAYRETLERYVRHRAWQVLVSACHDQRALDGTDRPSAPAHDARLAVDALAAQRIETAAHSPFAAALLRGLAGAADFTRDGLVTAAELELFVRDDVERSTQLRQTPQLYKLEEHDRGEFVFQVPGTELALERAPALSLAVCPYQGLHPYGAAERGRYFGRAHVVGRLVDQVKAAPLTVLLGASGSGKSSLLAAGLVPILRETPGWTVFEVRPDISPGDPLDDVIELPASTGAPVRGRTLVERVHAWLGAHPSGMLCLAIDQAEGLTMFASAEARERTLEDLAQALEVHGPRFHVVMALRSEFEPVFRASALGRSWGHRPFAVPPLVQQELREIIEQPARGLDLAFESGLVDTLINDVLHAPGGLPLLSFALRELYVRCAERNQDRLLTEADYTDMGRLSGALAQRADQLLGALVAGDAAYAATAHRVFLRMVVGRDDEWVRRRVRKDELVYDDPKENQRVATLLATFRGARLVVHDKDEWEPAHDWLVLGWPTLSTWRADFGAPAFALQFDLAEAAARWQRENRPGSLWTDDPRLEEAARTGRAPSSWLNARERAFVLASVRRRRRRSWTTLAALVLASAGGLILWDLYYRAHVDYYGDYVRRWGEPEGIDALTEGQAHRRSASVKLVRKGRLGHVQHVEIVRAGKDLAQDNKNGLGTAPELELGQNRVGQRAPCQWDLAYDSDSDAVSAETAKDRTGHVVYRLQYHGGSRERVKAAFLDDNGDDARIARGSAERVEFVRSPRGFDVEKIYTSRHGDPALDEEGIASSKLEYDDRGHIVERRYFDRAGAPVRNRDGIARSRRQFDDRGNEVGGTFLDELGRPCRHKVGGTAGWRSAFDDQGREVQRTFLDEAGQPTRHKDGYAGWRSAFDEGGNETRGAYLDEAGRPTRHKDGTAGWRSAFDEQGREIQHTFLDEAGQPTRNRDGYAGWRTTFDAHGNEVEGTFVDDTGKASRQRDGAAGWRTTFDNLGNAIRLVVVEEAGRPTRTKEGHTGWRATYDAHGNRTEIVFLDEAGHPTPDAMGAAGWQDTFDDRGHVTRRSFIDEAGRPTRRKDGTAGWRATFDDRGNEFERAYLDEAGQPTRHKDGSAAQRSTFDDRGNELQRTFFDDAGQPTRIDDGTAGWRATLDAHGNQLALVTLDEAGHSTSTAGGSAGWRAKFDAHDHQREVAFMDEAGRPTRSKQGIAGSRATFDAWGNQIVVAWFDEAGKPTRNTDGVAGWRSQFDARGNQTELAVFDEAGKPTRNTDGVAGWRSSFDARGNEITHVYVSETGGVIRNKGGVAGWGSTFDVWGHRITTTFAGEDGKPTPTTGGYVGQRMKVDAQGNVIETSWFDETGKPIRSADGFAGWHATLDARGNQIELAMFDEHGKPTRNRDGVFGWRSSFDARGNETARTNLGADGKPIRSTDGIVSSRATFDAWSRMVSGVGFDEAGKPTRNPSGVAGVQLTLDARGNAVNHLLLDETGRPARNIEGIAGWRSTFDGHGNETERAFFDEAGKPARDRSGVAVRRSWFDDWGNVLETSSLDLRGKLVRDDAGVARWRATFDAHRHEISRTSLDELGMPTRDNAGVASTRLTFDAYGNELERRIFDAAGKPARFQNHIVGRRSAFDARGRMIETVFVDAAGKPARDTHGIAGWRSRFDVRGNETARIFIDDKGEPTLAANGRAGWWATFDPWGEQIEHTYLDASDLGALRGER